MGKRRMAYAVGRLVGLLACLLALGWLLPAESLAPAGPVSRALPPQGAGVPAAIDRIVDGALAVILIGDSQQELLVPASWLPAGAGEGDRLILRPGATGAANVEIDHAATHAARERASLRLLRLKARGCAVTCPWVPAGEALGVSRRASP